MAKKNDGESGGNPGIGGTGDSLAVADFDQIEKAKPDEEVGIEKILASLMDPETGEVGDSADWKPAIVASNYFWPAARGLVIRGKVLGVEDRQTNLVVDGKPSKARFYTLELTAPCIAIRSADMKPGEQFPKAVECQPGMHVAVLERTILRRLESSIGKEVIIYCDGLDRTKRGLKLWKYRSWERVRQQPEAPAITTTGEAVPA